MYWNVIIFIYFLLCLVTAGFIIKEIWKKDNTLPDFMGSTFDRRERLDNIWLTAIIVFVSPIIVPVFVLFMVWDWLDRMRGTE